MLPSPALRSRYSDTQPQLRVRDWFDILPGPGREKTRAAPGYGFVERCCRSWDYFDELGLDLGWRPLCLDINAQFVSSHKCNLGFWIFKVNLTKCSEDCLSRNRKSGEQKCLRHNIAIHVWVTRRRVIFCKYDNLSIWSVTPFHREHRFSQFEIMINYVSSLIVTPIVEIGESNDWKNQDGHRLVFRWRSLSTAKRSRSKMTFQST